MAEGGEENTDGQTISTDDMQEDIFRIDSEIQALTDKAVGCVYRCVTCWKLSSEHPDNNVKYCHQKQSPLNVYGASLLRQHESAHRALELIQSGLLSTETQRFLNEKIELQRDLIDRHAVKVKEYKAKASRMEALSQKNSDSLNQVVNARSRDAEVFSEFLTKFRRYMNDELSSGSIEREYQTAAQRISIMRDQSVSDDTDDDDSDDDFDDSFDDYGTGDVGDGGGC